MKNIDKLTEAIQANGSKTFKLKFLTELLLEKKLNRLRQSRIKELEKIIGNNELYTYPSFEKILEKPIHGKSTITLTLKKINSTKDFFSTEEALENFIYSNDILQKELKLNKIIIKQSKLFGSKDKADFVGIKNKVKYLIEIKHKSSYYGIEQLLRYSGIVGEKNAKMILITGFEDPKIHNTFKGMHKEQRKAFEWYYYNWDGNDSLELIRIKI